MAEKGRHTKLKVGHEGKAVLKKRLNYPTISQDETWMTHPTKKSSKLFDLYTPINIKCLLSKHITNNNLQHLASESYTFELGYRITRKRHRNMDSRFPISSTSSKISDIEREGSSGPKLIEIMKQKLNHGAKMIQLGSSGKLFRKTFGIRAEEKLLQASQCYLYTTAGAIAGILFVSTERVAFCSEKSIKTYSTTGELLKFQYKVSIPLGKIEGVRESMNKKRPTNNVNYVELVTVDDFNFWFMGFVNYEKTLRYLHQAIGLQCLNDRC